MRRHVESGVLPGLVSLVYCRGRQQVETIGARAFDSNLPIERDTIFRGMAAGTQRPPGVADGREPARRPHVLNVPTFVRDFWTSAYQLIDD
jgi:hypothetical protein